MMGQHRDESIFNAAKVVAALEQNLVSVDGPKRVQCPNQLAFPPV